MTLIFIVGFVILIYLHFNLRGRVDVLEGLLRQKEAFVPPPLSYTSEGVPAPTPAPAPPYQPYPLSTGPDLSSRFVAWIQEDWLLKLGALLLLIGFGWFASYAFLNNWIGPMGRIALGLSFGAGLLLFGFWRLQKFTHQGSIFLVLGATIVLLTTFAARAVYGFFTPFAAMAMMFSASAFVAFASVQYRIRSLAFAGILLAGIAPLLVRSTPDHVGLFSYLFMVVLGTLVLVALRGWRDLLVAALTIVTLYSLPFWMSLSRIPDIKTLTYISFGFVLVFFVSNLFAFLKRGSTGEGGEKADLVSAVWIGAFLIPWIFVGIDRELQSLTLAGCAALFALGAFYLFVQTGNKRPLLAYAAVGVLLLGTATARELEGAALTIAFTLEAAALTFLAYALLRDPRVAMKASWLFVIPALLSLESIAKYPVHEIARRGYGYYGALQGQTTPILHKHFFVLLLLAAVLSVLGYVFMKLRTEATDDSAKKHTTLAEVYLVVGSCYAFVLLWLSLHHAFVADSATMTALVVYTLVGLATYLYGRTNDIRGLRLYGGVLLGFVVARLLLIEVWKMELTGRIFTFFVIGTLLMSTAFFGKKKSEVQETQITPPTL